MNAPPMPAPDRPSSANPVAGQPAGSPVSSVFDENVTNLFNLYTQFRYNELVCLHLTRDAVSLETKVRLSVVAVLAVSLFTGILPSLNQAPLNRIWAILTTTATLLTVYSLIEGSGEKQFRWFKLAMRFRTWASKFESFSTQVRRGKVEANVFDQTWDLYTEEMNRLVEEAGQAFDTYEARHQGLLTDELAANLRREKKI